MKKVLSLLSILCLLTLMGTHTGFTQEMHAADEEHQTEQHMTVVEDEEAVTESGDEMWNSFVDEYEEQAPASEEKSE